MLGNIYVLFLNGYGDRKKMGITIRRIYTENSAQTNGFLAKYNAKDGLVFASTPESVGESTQPQHHIEILFQIAQIVMTEILSFSPATAKI